MIWSPLLSWAPLRRSKNEVRPAVGGIHGRPLALPGARGGGAPRSQSPKHQSKKYSLVYIAIMSRSCAERRNRERGSLGTRYNDGAPLRGQLCHPTTVVGWCFPGDFPKRGCK